MNVTIPLYVEERKEPGEPTPRFTVRPLFFAEPSRTAELLSRATSKLAGDVRRRLDELGKQMRHEDLARWTFAPEVAEHHLTLHLQLRRSAPHFKALFVTFRALGRQLAFTPALPDLFFELDKAEQLRDRATEVLAACFRAREREDRDYVLPDELQNPPRAWLTAIELETHPNQQMPKEVPAFLAIGGGEEMSGQAELEKVGRCLDWLYPDELDRVVLREAEVAELERLLEDADRRPALLVGPPRVGKTALVHEYVYRQVERRGSPYSGKHNVWGVAPQRLISGMSYVGQWENRLLAILRHAQNRGHVLYFDDLLGLYAAGQTNNSDLSVAQVLRPYVERRDVRVLAEITPEALRVLRERDRGFADLFHVLPVAEPPEREARRILVETSRQLEGRHRCAFDLDVLPTAIDLQRRYVRDLAMPGKAAGFLRQLAAKYRGRAVTRDTVVAEFHARSGLSLAFLDRRRRLERGEVVEAVAAEVVGQPAAVNAMADAVCVARARLNDPGRPLASFLFLGPTGVGKTQAAKALAKFLFGDADRLLRFDMNEFIDAGSAARLVGTFWQPEGLLTSAVRRQPFSVVLLDEIEKAHPDVFDLLLQVLGEGRLTDALGRTADLANAIIVLTSNLGTREAASDFGLRPASATAAAAAASARDAVFIAAAERFFRPEFFNRLDRIVPFRPLDRADVGTIAGTLIRGVFERDGLLQRRCVLRVDPRAMDRIVDQGFHPQLGARALKRAIERQLTRPVASRLAAMAPGTPTIISLYPGADGVAVHTQGLDGAAAAPPAPAPQQPADPLDTLERVFDVLDRVEADHAGDDVPGASLTQGQIDAAQFRYLAIREHVGRVRQMADRLYERLLAPPKPAGTTIGRIARRVPTRQASSMRRFGSPEQALWPSFVAAEEVNHYLSEVATGAVPVDQTPGEQVAQVVREAALLHAMSAADPGADRVLIHIRALAEAPTAPQEILRRAYLGLFDRQYGFTCEPVKVGVDEDRLGPASALLLLEMPAAQALLAAEAGTHLFSPDLRLVPVQVMVMPLGPDDDPAAIVRAHGQRHTAWRAALAEGRAAVDDDPWPLRPVVRLYGSNSVTVDLRSGLVSTSPLPTSADLRAFLLSQLPLPEELSSPE